MSEPRTAYRVAPDVEPDADAALARWVEYQAQRCRETALELEVAAGHAAMSAAASNTQVMADLRASAKELATRAAEIARRCRARGGTR